MPILNGWRLVMTATLKGKHMPNMTKDHADNLHDVMAEAVRAYLVDECNATGKELRIRSTATNRKDHQ